MQNVTFLLKIEDKLTKRGDNMAVKKGGSVLFKLKSTESHFFFVKKKNPKKLTKKLQFNKYDPIVKKHVLFVETKI